MDTLQERLAALADDAPTGGAPPTELWARGRRTHQLRVTALAVTALVVGVVGVGVGVRLVGEGGGHRSEPEPAGTTGFTLPIDYPVGEELPDLGDAPGRLAAVWLVPDDSGGAPEAVGLVARTTSFGKLPIELPDDDPQAPLDVGLALSPDGRRVAYQTASGELVVRDLVSGDSDTPLSDFRTRAGYLWTDRTHLLGHVAGGGQDDAWVWKPGAAPQLVDLATDELPSDALWFSRPGAVGPGTRDWWLAVQGGGPESCSPPILENWSARLEAPGLCDVLGFIPANTLLGHGSNADDAGAVIAVDPGWSDDEVHRRVVVDAGAPDRVVFALDLVAEALQAGGTP